MGVTFPNETSEYRRARAALLQRELVLRREMEAVATQLRTLPPAAKFPKTTHSTASAPTVRRRRCGYPRCFAAATP